MTTADDDGRAGGFDFQGLVASAVATQNDARLLELCEHMDRQRLQVATLLDVSSRMTLRNPRRSRAEAATDRATRVLEDLADELAALVPATPAGLQAMARQALLEMSRWENGKPMHSDGHADAIAYKVLVWVAGGDPLRGS